jgi:nitrate reductase beta subunit
VYRVALPLHPEYRTMPMVWYIPPLSPVVDVLHDTGHDAEDAGNLFGAIDTLPIPVEYLAGLFTAGDPAPVTRVLRTLAAMPSYMRRITLRQEPDESIAAAVGMTGTDVTAMYRLLAIAKYDERRQRPVRGGVRPACPGLGRDIPRPQAAADHDRLRRPEDKGSRINLLNWDGKGRPPGLFRPARQMDGADQS